MDKGARILTLMGAALIAAALALTACNAAESRRAAEHSAAAVAKLSRAIAGAEPEPEESPGEPGPGTSTPAGMPGTEIDGRLYIGTLSIPALERELPVLSECDEAGLKIAPCRYAGSVYTGDLVICAHNIPAHLGGLSELGFGEKLFFTDMDGKSYEYVVRLQELLEPDAVEEMTGSGWALSLFTCSPGGKARVTVRCGLVQ